MDAKVKEILEREFKPDSIKKRKQSGKVFSYIPHNLIEMRLNEGPGQDGWRFEIVDTIMPSERMPNEVIIQGRMSLRLEDGTFGAGKEQWGSARVTYYSGKDHVPENMTGLGDNLKSATTDCIKKCATLFGVALHLYGAPEDTAESVGDSPGESSSGKGGDKPAEEEERAEGGGSASGGEGRPKKETEDNGEESVNTVMAEALELQRAYMMANKVNDKEARKAVLGTETKPAGYEAWKMYRDLLTGGDANLDALPGTPEE